MSRQVDSVHQMLAGCAPGDAITNQALAIQKCLQAWGYKSRIFAEHRDPALAGACEDYRSYHGDAHSLLILHYSIGSSVTAYARALPDRLALYYHNITPAHFMAGYDRRLAADLTQGRADLLSLRDVPYVMAASAFSAEELRAAGFAAVTVIPPYFGSLRSGPPEVQTPAGRRICEQLGGDGWVNLLFVGRITPNKRQEDLLRLLAYYQRVARAQSRLLLVGSAVNGEAYLAELEVLVQEWALQHVHFCGRVSQDELYAYYRVGNVFVSMSEHEGFGVPLIEAMTLDVPVLAYAAGAVAETLGPAGILFRQKDYARLTELIELLVVDSHLRGQVLARQRQHAQTFSAAAIEQRLRDFLSQIIGS